ncbi:hypothetical protein NIES2101_41565 [Calothrix sp. HK-06]|nr:hypothetical protein NIES2101_41565 [Calothrix sp. HK-06]
MLPEEIARFRSELAAYPEAIAAIDIIENCDGNLEDATAVLAIELGEDIDRDGGLLENLAKRCRPIVCQEDFKDDLLPALVAGIMETLMIATPVPPGLAALVAIYITNKGVKNFCKDFKV